MNELITLASNNVFVLTEVMVVCVLGYLSLKPMTTISRSIVTAWLLVAFGYMLRIGYWSAAIHNAEAGQVYAWWANEYRHFLAIPALMVLVGNLIFLGNIENFSLKARWLIGAFIIMLSIYLALLKFQ